MGVEGHSSLFEGQLREFLNNYKRGFCKFIQHNLRLKNFLLWFIIYVVYNCSEFVGNSNPDKKCLTLTSATASSF